MTLSLEEYNAIYRLAYGRCGSGNENKGDRIFRKLVAEAIAAKRGMTADEADAIDKAKAKARHEHVTRMHRFIAGGKTFGCRYGASK